MLASPKEEKNQLQEEKNQLREAKTNYNIQMKFQGQYPDEAKELKQEYEKEVARIKSQWNASSNLAGAPLMLASASDVPAVIGKTQKVIARMKSVLQEATRLEDSLSDVKAKLAAEPDQVAAAVQAQPSTL